MKINVTAVIAIMATLMFCALFASTAQAVIPAVNAPVWNQGDSWAMGKSVDLDAEFSNQLNQIQHMLENMTNATSLDEFQVQAMASSWLKVEVVTANAEEYVLHGKLAARFNADVAISVTGEMPAVGTKAWTDFNYPKTPRTISADISLDMAFVSEMTIVFEKPTMAIKSIETMNKASAIASVNIMNIPEIKLNLSGISYSYKNIDFDINFDMELNVGASFSPALNLIKFPLSVGDNWTISSLASITGNVSGFLDVKGLSASDKESLFSNSMLQNAGITDFPIDFSKLSTENEPKIVNGTFLMAPRYVNASMECTGVELVTLPIFGEVAVYEISANGGSEKFYYSDDVHFLTGAESSLEGIEMPVELGGVQMPEAMISMEPVTAQEAEQNINSISAYQSDLSGQAGNSNGDGLTGLLSNVAIVGLIVVIVALAAVVAVVIVKSKKK